MTTVQNQDTTSSTALAQLTTVPPDETGRAYRQVRTAFYQRLAALVERPTRPTATQGLAWRSGQPRRYHTLIILPYIGGFDRPRCRDGYPWTVDGRPVPRIHVNHYDWRPSHAQRRRWSPAADDHLWLPVQHRLELTVALEELVDFIPWVVAWTRAVEANNSSLILPMPHQLTRAATAEEMLNTSYAWTLRADAEYDRRWNAREESRRRMGKGAAGGCGSSPGDRAE